ncbi:MAG: PilZ domain-containing protein [Myxococcota bacterium]
MSVESDPELDLGAIIAVIDPAPRGEPSRVMSDVAGATAAHGLKTAVVGQLPAKLGPVMSAAVDDARPTLRVGVLALDAETEPELLVRRIARCRATVSLLDLRETGPDAAALADVLLVVAPDALARHVELPVNAALAARIRDLARDEAEIAELDMLLGSDGPPAETLAKASLRLPQMIRRSLAALRVDIVGEGEGPLMLAERLSEHWGVRLPSVHRPSEIGALQTKLLSPDARELRSARSSRTRHSVATSVLNHVRAEPRHRVQRACQVTLGDGTSWGAWLVDISASGLGLVLDAPVSRGDIVRVTLPDGPTHVEVRRIQGRQVGGVFCAAPDAAKTA